MAPNDRSTGNKSCHRKAHGNAMIAVGFDFGPMRCAARDDQLVVATAGLDPHFAKLADQYHEINREIHRIEAGVEATSEFRETDLRKSRMALKDEIAQMLEAG